MSFRKKSIERKRIKVLASQIRPVVDFKNIGLCFIAPIDLFNESFLKNPRSVEIAPQMDLLAEIQTRHTHVIEDEFIPTVAEVLSQIPEEFLDQTKAFQVMFDEKSLDDKSLEEGYHIATTRLYIF